MQVPSIAPSRAAVPDLGSVLEPVAAGSTPAQPMGSSSEAPTSVQLTASSLHVPSAATIDWGCSPLLCMDGEKPHLYFSLPKFEDTPKKIHKVKAYDEDITLRSNHVLTNDWMCLEDSPAHTYARFMTGHTEVCRYQLEISTHGSEPLCIKQVTLCGTQRMYKQLAKRCSDCAAAESLALHICIGFKHDGTVQRPPVTAVYAVSPRSTSEYNKKRKRMIEKLESKAKDEAPS